MTPPPLLSGFHTEFGHCTFIAGSYLNTAPVAAEVTFSIYLFKYLSLSWAGIWAPGKDAGRSAFAELHIDSIIRDIYHYAVSILKAAIGPLSAASGRHAMAALW